MSGGTGERVGTAAGARAGVSVATEPEAAREAALVLVTVKSAQTAEAGAALAAVLPPGAVVVSLQNGVRNADILREALPGRHVLAAMVPFNVIRRGPGRTTARRRAPCGSTTIRPRRRCSRRAGPPAWRSSRGATWPPCSGRSW